MVQFVQDQRENRIQKRQGCGMTLRKDAAINPNSDLQKRTCQPRQVLADLVRVGFETHDWRASRLTRSMTEAA